MKLVVPAIFQTDFLDTVGTAPIDHLYGAMGGDVGLRATQWLPQPKADELASYVEAARARSIAFFYCLNVACLGNREFTAEGQLRHAHLERGVAFDSQETRPETSQETSLVANAPAASRRLLAPMFLLFIAGLLTISIAPLYGN